MTLLSWDETMSVGVKSLDADHKKIISVMNKLYNSLKRGQKTGNLDKVFVELFSYFAAHAAKEEEMLVQTEYPGAEAHIQVHRKHKKELDDFYASYKRDKGSVETIDLLILLCGWWQKHVLTEDKKYKEHFHKKRVS